MHANSEGNRDEARERDRARDVDGRALVVRNGRAQARCVVAVGDGVLIERDDDALNENAIKSRGKTANLLSEVVV
jgi:hypothetical protein